ncbi:MAG: type II toxin-antitoxin system HicA family toxin [bacterium]
MTRLNIIPAKKMIKILRFLDFELIRTKGSHHFFFNKKTQKTTTIPIHGNEDLGTGILKEILKDIDLSVAEYEKLRRKIH